MALPLMLQNRRNLTALASGAQQRGSIPTAATPLPQSPMVAYDLKPDMLSAKSGGTSKLLVFRVSEVQAGTFRDYALLLFSRPGVEGVLTQRARFDSAKNLNFTIGQYDQPFVLLLLNEGTAPTVSLVK